MFKKFLDTGMNLTRIGLDVVSKVISTTEKPVQAEERREQEASTMKTTISALKANLLRQATFKHDKILLEAAPRRTSVSNVRVPDLKFTAAGSKKVVELRKIHQPAVLFISHRENAAVAADINWQLIQPYLNSHLPFFTANIILLNEFPPFTHPMVRRELRKSYRDILRDYVKDRQLAEKIVHLLPDWKGESLDAFHIAQHRPLLATVVVSPEGNIQRIIQSIKPLTAIRKELADYL